MTTLGFIFYSIAVFLLGGWCIAPLFRLQLKVANEAQRKLDERKVIIDQREQKLKIKVDDALATIDKFRAEIVEKEKRIKEMLRGQIIHININDRAKVKLTEFGRASLRETYEQLKLTPVAEQEDYALWDLMCLFGKHMYMGNNDLPFDPEIEIKRWI